VNVWQLITDLLPVLEATVRMCRNALNRGCEAVRLHDLIVDHMMELPPKIRDI
jgi:hypothetical protein